MALLDLLSNLPSIEVIVAHFNHGIREDSPLDEELVADAAVNHGLVFEAGHARLGSCASEEQARIARYTFLEDLRQKHRAKAIITAHHQDDLIETAMINLLRGTGRRGLVAISSNKNVIRPLLGYPKAQLMHYAKSKGLEWRDDSTNQSKDILRNYIRHNIVPKMSAQQRQRFLKDIEKIKSAEPQIESWLKELSKEVGSDDSINRARFSLLPSELGNELLIYRLRQAGMSDFDKRSINRLNVAIRTAKEGSRHPVKKDLEIELTAKTARFTRRGPTAS